MKNHRLFWLLTAPLLTVPFSSGCMFLKAPPPEPTPTPAPTPKAPYFDPTAGQSRGTAMNKAGDPLLPDAFRIASPISGDTISVQSMDTVMAGKPPKAVIKLGPPDTMKLAGIVAPTVDPGLQGAKMAITNWTVGQNLDIDKDAKFPLDLEGRPVVQVFFKGGKGKDGKPGPYVGQTLSLNRMLVRSGWAVVDLYSPTSFDTSQWIYDEAHARMNKLGFWRYGQLIQQRVPSQGRKGSKSVVAIQPNTRGGAVSGAIPGATASGVPASPSSSSSAPVPSGTTSNSSAVPSGTSPGSSASPQSTTPGQAGVQVR